ncbi:MAG: hypothetical protein GY754_08055 [bacterium]|nr:hypothetical protein [bacterium]
MSRVYDFSEILSFIDSLEGFSVECHKKQLTPDEYYTFFGPKFHSPPIMVCYEKKGIKFKCGLIYIDDVRKIEKFLERNDVSNEISELDSFKIDIA